MDVAQNPETVVYCVLQDGTMSTMTREADQQLTAWSRQNTNGTYTSIAIIPSQSENYDEAWVVVERWINGVQKKYIEYFNNIDPPPRQDMCNYLHCSLLYDAYNTTSTSSLSISLSGTGGTITVTSSGPVFAATDVNRRLRVIDESGAILGNGTITSRTSSTVVNVAVDYNFNTTSYGTSRWGISVGTISGLDHLEAEEVNVLADGGTDYPVKTVSNGSITLAHDYFVVRVGLAYDQILKTLPKEVGNQRGTAQGRKQRINELAFKVNRSHKGFKVGGNATELDVVSYIESTTTEILYTGTIPNTEFILDRISFRDPSTSLGTPELLYTGIIPNITFRGDYESGSQVYIINEDPLP
jgi:hypothetical protein